MLEVKNLTKSFGSRVILDNVNLTVKDGEILSIVGPSGAGKTTLLRCITGLRNWPGRPVTGRERCHFTGCHPAAVTAGRLDLPDFGWNLHVDIAEG